MEKVASHSPFASGRDQFRREKRTLNVHKSLYPSNCVGTTSTFQRGENAFDCFRPRLNKSKSKGYMKVSRHCYSYACQLQSGIYSRRTRFVGYVTSENQATAWLREEVSPEVLNKSATTEKSRKRILVSKCAACTLFGKQACHTA